MKNFLLPALYSFGLGIGVLIICFIFIEGWEITPLVIMLVLTCMASGFLMGKIQPQSKFYAGILISAPMLIAFPTLQEMWDLLSSPFSINSKNFYVILPLLAVLFSYIGVCLGYISAKRKQKLGHL